MAVRKFRSIEEMRCDHWLPAGDPRLWRAIEEVWDFARTASGMTFPPGVYKHRTIEESEQLRDEWEVESLRRRGNRSS